MLSPTTGGPTTRPTLYNSTKAAFALTRSEPEKRAEMGEADRVERSGQPGPNEEQGAEADCAVLEGRDQEGGECSKEGRGEQDLAAVQPVRDDPERDLQRHVAEGDGADEQRGLPLGKAGCEPVDRQQREPPVSSAPKTKAASVAAGAATTRLKTPRRWRGRGPA